MPSPPENTQPPSRANGSRRHRRGYNSYSHRERELRQLRYSVVILFGLCLLVLAWAVWASVGLYQRNAELIVARALQYSSPPDGFIVDAARRADPEQVDAGRIREIYALLTRGPLGPRDAEQLVELASQLVELLEFDPGSFAPEGAALLDFLLRAPRNLTPDLNMTIQRILRRLSPEELLLLKEMAMGEQAITALSAKPAATATAPETAETSP